MDCRVGLRHNFCCQCPILIPRPDLESAGKTARDIFIYLFSKSILKKVIFCPTKKWVAIPKKARRRYPSKLAAHDGTFEPFNSNRHVIIIRFMFIYFYSDTNV